MGSTANDHKEAAAWYQRYRHLRMKFALGVAAVAAVAMLFGWLRNTRLTIDPGPGTPIGPSVRTDTHIATLIQTLEPYVPSLHRDPGKDRYAISIHLVPLDGSDPQLVPIKGDLAPNEFALAKVLGGVDHYLWYDVNGVGAIDLRSYTVVGTPPPVPGTFQGGLSALRAPEPDAFLAAGLITGPGTWMGLHSSEELQRDCATGKFVRRVVPQESAKQLRRFQRGALEDPVDGKYHRIRTMQALDTNGFLNAAFLRMDDRSEPLLLTGPESVLMVHTSAPGAQGTLVVSRVDLHGRSLWSVDTGIHRYSLSQVLPGVKAFAFMGTRPPVPDQVSEPLVVIIDNTTGKAVTHSLWP
jgi:hypothetical protein